MYANSVWQIMLFRKSGIVTVMLLSFFYILMKTTDNRFIHRITATEIIGIHDAFFRFI